MRLKFGVLMSVISAVVFGLWGQTQLQAENLRLYVDNSRADTISIIDLNSFKVVDEIKVGADRVHAVALQPDGRVLFTTSEADHTLRIVDTSTLKVTAVIKLTGKPNQCAVTPDGRYVVVPIRDGDSINIVDVTQQKIVKVLPIKEPHNAVNIGSNRYTFVSSMGSHEINVVDFETMSYSAVIPVGGRPRPFVLTPDGKTMYVAVSYLHGFNIVDVADKKVLEKVEIPSEHPAPGKSRQFETPDTYTHGLALTPDGTEVWVTSLLDDCVYIYNLKERKVTGRLMTGDGPNWVVFSPDGKYVAVSNTDSDDVSIFDARAKVQVAKVKVGKVPKRIAIATAPDDK